MAKSKQSETHHNHLVLIGIVIMVILSAITLGQVSSVKKELTAHSENEPEEADKEAAPAAAAPSQPNAAPTNNVDMKALIDDDDVKGDPNAPVTIVEWSDFECPFCVRFYDQTLGQIQENYIDTGKVKLVYRDFPLGFHAQAQKAAEAAECAGEQGKFWEMHDKLFEDGVVGGVATFKGYAAELGLDSDKFDECLDSGEMASEVKKDMEDGGNAGIRGTPGFIVNGKLISGAQPYSAFEAAIEAALNN